MANTTARPLSTTSAAAAALAPPRAAKAFDISAVLTTPIARLSEDQLRHCSEAVRIFKKKMGSLQIIHNEFQILEVLEMREQHTQYTYTVHLVKYMYCYSLV